MSRWISEGMTVRVLTDNERDADEEIKKLLLVLPHVFSPGCDIIVNGRMLIDGVLQ